MVRKLIIIIAILFSALSGIAKAQDPGIRDTLEFMPTTIGIGISTPVAVRAVAGSPAAPGPGAWRSDTARGKTCGSSPQ